MTAPQTLGVQALWERRHVLVCVGTGGVGKTTVAAALAMAAAKQGRRVLVMTIDPSRRLAQNLGLSSDHDAPVQVPVPGATGSVHALVVDVQRTFDALIAARAKSPEQAQSIRQNRIYQHFSASLAGSHEYAAIEKLWDGVHDGRFDLVVLDTPPAQNALDFLEAPQRILQFLEGQALMENVPGASWAKRVSRRLFDLGGGLIKNNVAKIAGGETLDEVLAFLRALSDMYDSFTERAKGIEALLASDKCAFALIGGTAVTQQDAIVRFEHDLKRFHIEPHGYVLNRVRKVPIIGGQAEAAVMDTLRAQPAVAALNEAERNALCEAVEDELVHGRLDAEIVDACAKRARGRPVFVLYEREGDVDRPDALLRLGSELLGQRAR